jgi:parallel beta-helix repeat protein
MALMILLISVLVSAWGIHFFAVSDVGSQVGSSNSIVLSFNFCAPEITENVSGVSVTLSSLPQYGAAGEPVLPLRLVRVLLPQGKDYENVNVVPGYRQVLQGSYNVMYGQTAMPISSNVTAVDKPDESVYDSAEPYPSSLFSDLTEQYVRGYKMLIFDIYPVHYIPMEGEIYYFESMTVNVALKVTGEISPLFRNLPQDKALVASLVDNPEAADTYTTTSKQFQSNAGSSNQYEYVLITDNALAVSFQPLVDWKNQEGVSATIVSLESIMSNPAYNSDGQFGDGDGSPKFNDTQAHVRNFIKYAYVNWGTEYVLLGGGDDIIPARGVYDYASDFSSNYTDSNIPCDMYYGGLSGSWDENNDSIFGEAVYHFAGPMNATAGEEADFYADVYVGRAPVDTPQEAANFVSKTIAYEQSTQPDYLNKALAIGTTLDNITEGGNGEDAVTDIIPQYTTTKLYTRDGTYSPAAVVNEMDSGVNIVTDDGHAYYNNVMGLSISDVDSLTNTQYFFVYSLGCYSAAFDEATSGPEHSIAEHFVFDSHGAFAYIGNSRYGWYISGSINGPGDRYMEEFFTVLNSGVRNLGAALQLSKEEEPILDRWTCFDLNLLGDPETEITTAPGTPTAHFETNTDLLTPPRIGGLVNLQGTASGANFTNYTIDFGVGTAPTSWSTTGITLLNNGASQVVNGTLATWNTTKVALGIYTLRITAFNSEGLVGQDTQVVVVNANAIPVYIMADGSVDPSTAPIQRIGDTYELTANIYSDSEGLVIERGGITLDGAGHTILGSGGGAAGIYLDGTDNVTIKNISVEAHLYGIYMQQCSDNTIIGDSMENDTHGIFLLDSSNNNIIVSNITDNYDGVSLLSSSDSNSIVGCRITGNDGDLGEGIYFYMSSNNLIYHNLLAGNRLNVYDAAWDCADPGLISPSINTWDAGYPSGGNYWSDYNGTDVKSGPYQNLTGSDGIGDTPYVIDMNNLDHYPLFTPVLPIHFIAVTNVTLYKTVVGQDYGVNITVTVADQGTYAETFTVTAYANTNSIISQNVTLSSGTSTNFAFTWNTTDFAYGNYTISAYAWPVPNETSTADNNFTGGLVAVSIVGDITGPQGWPDGKVTMSDIAIVARAFGSKPGSSNWNPNADINGDGIANMKDIALVARNFGQHYP